MSSMIADRQQKQTNTTSEPVFANHEYWALVALIVMAAAVFRLWRLDTRGFWVDEITTIRSARALVFFNADGFCLPRFPHFLSHLFVRAMLHLGETPFLVRLPSAAFGILSVVMFAAMLQRWFGRAVALIGAVWLAFSPYQLYFSLQARYYAEVICFSAASVFFLYDLLPSTNHSLKRRLLSCMLFLLINILAYGLHPTTIVFFASQGALLLLLWLHFIWTSGKSERRMNRRMHLLASMIACLGVLALLLAATRIGAFVVDNLKRSNLIALLQHKPLSLPLGVGWHWNYFLFPRRYGMLYSSDSQTWLGWLVMAFFICGVIGAWRKNKAFLLMALLGYLATLASTFMYASPLPFDPKYSSYLFPIYIGLAALGLLQLAAKLQSNRIATLLACGSIAAVQMPAVGICLRGNFDGYYEALKSVARASFAREVLYSTVQGASIMRYYQQHEPALSRIEVRTTRDLDQDASAGIGKIHFKQALARGERPWVAVPEQADPPVANETMRRIAPFLAGARMLPALNGSRHFGVPLRRAYGQSMLVFKGREKHWAKVSLPLHWPVCAVDAFSAKVDLPDAAASMRIDDASVASQNAGHSFQFPLKEGLHHIAIEPVNAASARTSLHWSENANEIEISLDHFDSIWPENNRWDFIEDKQGSGLLLRQNNILAYSLDSPSTGTLALKIHGEFKPPFSVMEAALDEQRLGLFCCDKADAADAIHEFASPITKGQHTIQLSMLSDLGTAPVLPGNDSDALIRGIHASIQEGKPQPPSGATCDGMALYPWPAELAASFLSASPKQDNALWLWSGAGEKINSVQGEIGIRMQPAMKNTYLRSRPLVCMPARWVYGSVEMRTENLENHTANIAVTQVQASTRMAQRIFCYATGMRQSTPWKRLPFAVRLQDGFDAFVIEIAIYSNSLKRSPDPGVVYLRNLCLYGQ